MRPKYSDRDNVFEILPSDDTRRSMLKALSQFKRPARPDEVFRQVQAARTTSPEEMSEAVKDAIKDGLIDIQGSEGDTAIRLTPFGERIAAGD